MKIDLKDVSIFLEKQVNKEDVLNEENLKEYLLSPFPLSIDMYSSKIMITPTNSNSKSVMNISGGHIVLNLGLREVNSYLLISQVIFQFLNDKTILEQEINWRAKAKVQQV